MATWEWWAFLAPIFISIGITWYQDKVNYISIKVLWTLIIVLISILSFVIRAFINVINIVQENKQVFPKLIKIKKHRLLFSASSIFTHQSVVSIYNKNDIEEFVGYGHIETITTDEVIQVIVDEYNNEWNETQVESNKNNIILRPSLPINMLNEVQSRGNNNE